MHDALNVWLGLDKYDWMKKPAHQPTPTPPPIDNVTGGVDEWEELDKMLIESLTENPSDSDILSQTQEDKNNKRKKQENSEEPKKKRTKTSSATPKKTRKDPAPKKKEKPPKDPDAPKRKRAPRKKKEVKPIVRNGEECGICLEPQVKKTCLNNCEHTYCWQCISQWSEITNLCPLCQARFDSLTQVEEESPQATKVEEKDRKDLVWRGVKLSEVYDDSEDEADNEMPFIEDENGEILFAEDLIQRIAEEVKKSRVQQHQCEKCDKIFNRLADFKRHLLVHTEERNFKCEHCSASFKLKGELKRHSLTHTKTEAFVCSYEDCGKSFTLKGNLDRHIKTVHLKEKKCECPHDGCGKSFGQSGDLKRHLESHKDIRKFKCPKCDNSFVQKAHMLAHLARH